MPWEGLAFESDCAARRGLVQALVDAGIVVHGLRDLTRGGLASGLVEIAQTSGKHIHVEGEQVPVGDAVRGACEILGLDPFYVANEGCLIAFVPAGQAERALACLRGHPQGAGACRIGSVTDEEDGMVTLSSEIGATRILDMLSGEQLPRMC